LFGANTPVKYTKQKDGISISTEGITVNDPDTIIMVEVA
jgi:alpha-L-fucosidase